ncbi:MAG: ribosome biogenesis/translation initiation ATPase RLI [Candidatus Aenigmarchaeota archaeon ex4484_14]|nr:MAG: ribosome biogenesis/translation initiation ATPase RLI [Candidatus Aenigmarchaeota archaeon ex4484_14]
MRIAVIDYELCDPKKCDFACMKICPRNRAGEECISKKEIVCKGVKRVVPVIDENMCIGCALCVKKCPKKAISVVNTPEQLKEAPVHRFGKNAFILFRLPIPVKGVVGMLGPNGVGKTTALKILAGEIKPNLGSVDKEPDWSSIVKTYRGNELQSYLEKLSQGHIKTAYKPQNVSDLIKETKEAGSAFLEGVSKEIIDTLEIKHCIDRESNTLSGGELQRVAIARTASQDADIYYFDEPSSYLDVRQRMNMAKLIRGIAQDKPVLVVEHDLATLDFLADRIHVFYGVPAVFGVVSKPYSALNGINIFLNGYIREDNVRIRQPITFEHSLRPEIKSKEAAIEFGTIEKSFKSFSMLVEPGKIYKEQILGIFGANGLGKTTFAKILAGTLKPDKGKITENIKISYKPQYLSSSFDGTVADILAAVKDPYSIEFKSELLEPLGIVRLLERQTKNLSGGELQRVAIALCLAREADSYLLDEPSAYLDIDQRLAVAKILRDHITRTETSVCVIDHDLLFLSYLSDHAMVFTGESGKRGHAVSMPLNQGFNQFLKEVGITFRQDPETKRPRANKLGSQKDTEQKEQGKYFLMG